MVRTASSPLPQPRASSVTAYCALFALAVLQLGVALHHDQHSASDLTNTCVACVQLEQQDDALLPDAASIAIAPAATDAISFEPQRGLSRSARHYNSRAPPLHS